MGEVAFAHKQFDILTILVESDTPLTPIGQTMMEIVWSKI